MVLTTGYFPSHPLDAKTISNDMLVAENFHPRVLFFWNCLKNLEEKTGRWCEYYHGEDYISVKGDIKFLDGSLKVHEDKKCVL